MISLLDYHVRTASRRAKAFTPALPHAESAKRKGLALLAKEHRTTATLRRYTRPREEAVAARREEIIPFSRADEAIAASKLSAGSRALLRGLLRVGTARVFPGGGVGIEYGSLLKTAARPEYVAAHVHEAAAHLRDQQTDLLLVPGMSGYPIGAMYALAAEIPAVLLKKTRIGEADPNAYLTGAFVIPSYTGIDLELRVAGGDDIIDKATMSQAVGESAVAIGEAAMGECLSRYRAQTGDDRPARTRVSVVAWVTPLIKSYNQPRRHLWQAFQLHPFAGLDLYAVNLDPPAIGVSGAGMLGFAAGARGS
jgi:hypothetical protein